MRLTGRNLQLLEISLNTSIIALEEETKFYRDPSAKKLIQELQTLHKKVKDSKYLITEEIAAHV